MSRFIRLESLIVIFPEPTISLKLLNWELLKETSLLFKSRISTLESDPLSRLELAFKTNLSLPNPPSRVKEPKSLRLKVSSVSSPVTDSVAKVASPSSKLILKGQSCLSITPVPNTLISTFELLTVLNLFENISNSSELI